jgi:hypothetical protein
VHELQDIHAKYGNFPESYTIKNTLGYKQSEKTIQKRRELLTGRSRPVEASIKQSETMKQKYLTQSWIHAGKTYEDIYGVEQAEQRKAKLRGPRGPRKNPPGPQELVTCPQCGKTGGISNMKRYHFDNCATQ